MPAYSRNDSAWTQAVMRQRGTSWSGDDALGFVRDGGEWVQFQAPAGDLALLKPENLTADPQDISASFTWTNPTPGAVTPTHIQIRIPNTTPVWTELEYPATANTVGYLTAATEYQFQVRYIVRADGSITMTGEIAEVFFTTLALGGPGTPAPDPGGTGPDSTVLWGDTGGTPGAVGSGGCWWEYVVQTATTPASGAMTWSDTAVTGDFAGDAGSLDIDLVAEGLACGGLARYKYREVCNGVPEDYEYGDPFIMPCDWDAACGGAANRDISGVAPFSDSIFAMPKVCAEPTDALNIEDHISTTVYGKLSGFFGTSLDTDQDVDIVVGGTIVGYEPIVAGPVGALALLEDADDFSCMGQAMLADVPGGAGGSATDAFPIFRYGRNVALSAVRASATTWYARVSWQLAAGGGTTLTGTTALSLDEFHGIGASFDNSTGEVILYVDGVQDASTTGEALALSDAAMGQDVQVYGNSFIRFKLNAAWDRVLSPAEFSAGYALDKYLTINFLTEESTTSPPLAVLTGDLLVFNSVRVHSYAAGPGIPLVDGSSTGDFEWVTTPFSANSIAYSVHDYVHNIYIGVATADGNIVFSDPGGVGKHMFAITNLGGGWSYDTDMTDAVAQIQDVHVGGAASTVTPSAAVAGGTEQIVFSFRGEADVDTDITGYTDLIGSYNPDTLMSSALARSGSMVTRHRTGGTYLTDAITVNTYESTYVIELKASPVALGGAIAHYDSGTHLSLIYKNSGSIREHGQHGLTAPATIDYLIVGGGGGGGYAKEGGGGGGGEVLTGTGLTLPTLPSAITIGAGGGGQLAANGAASNGGDTIALGFTASGGQGAHDDYYNNADAAGLGPRGGGISGSGNNGGDDLSSSFGGGGGGDSGVGENSETDGVGHAGDGGPGTSNSYETGVAQGYGGGGGGGGWLGGAAGTGQDGGGDGGDPPTIARANSGGGGGGRWKNFGGALSGGAGGSGIVIVRVTK